MNLTLKKYRMLDLTIFSVLALVAEVISIFALKEFTGAGFYLSLSVLVTIIAIIRWGWIGSVVYVIAGVPMIFLSGLSFIEGLIIYPFANTFITLSTIMFLFYKRDKVIENKFLFFTFQVSIFIGISIGKGFASLVIGGTFLNIVLSYLISQLFCMIMTYLFLSFLRKKEDLIVNMEKYILSVRVEEGKK